MELPKIIQICTREDEEGGFSILGLDEEGNLWYLSPQQEGIDVTWNLYVPNNKSRLVKGIAHG